VGEKSSFSVVALEVGVTSKYMMFEDVTLGFCSSFTSIGFEEVFGCGILSTITGWHAQTKNKRSSEAFVRYFRIHLRLIFMIQGEDVQVGRTVGVSEGVIDSVGVAGVYFSSVGEGVIVAVGIRVAVAKASGG
jgi:hypothetical protein